MNALKLQHQRFSYRGSQIATPPEVGILHFQYEDNYLANIVGGLGSP
jgi:hypothetical protein